MIISKQGTQAMTDNLRAEGHISRADYLELLGNEIEKECQLARLANAYLEPVKCRKCGHIYNRGYCCINCGDSNPSESED